MELGRETQYLAEAELMCTNVDLEYAMAEIRCVAWLVRLLVQA